MAVKDKELIINGKAIRSPEQQVWKNMEDIAELQEEIKPEYKCTTELSTSATSVAKSYTNAGEDVNSGWLLDPIGNKFKITGGDEDNLLIVFYSSLRGPQGADGEDGTDGVTPNINANATVDSQTGTPSVVVTKTGTDSAPTFIFAFHNLKGETGTSLISVEVVASLPASGNAGTLYFVQSSDPSSQNVYDEYIWLSSGWEKLGSQTIDLTNYIQKSYTNGLVKNDGTIDTTPYLPSSSLIIENIKDMNGKNRFVEGNGTPQTITGFSPSYCKWSLSGTHIMFVLAGEFISGSSISNQVLARFYPPQWILDKIYPTFRQTIETRDVKMYANDISNQSTTLYIEKENDHMQIVNLSNVTFSQTRYLRIQFDLIIDNN